MAHGAEDWGVSAPISIIYKVNDLGELAARLGSINTFDRRGSVIFQSSFEDGLKPFLTFAFGASSAVGICSTTSRNGPTSCEIGAGPSTDDYAGFRHHNPIPRSTRIGIEVSFASDAPVQTVLVGAVIDDLVINHKPQVEFRWLTGDLVYYDENGIAQAIASGLSYYAYEKLFNTLKLVFDTELREYVHVIFNETEYDLTGIKYYVLAAGATKYFYQVCQVTTKEDDTHWTYFDDLIVTQEEP